MPASPWHARRTAAPHRHTAPPHRTVTLHRHTLPPLRTATPRRHIAHRARRRTDLLHDLPQAMPQAMPQADSLRKPSGGGGFAMDHGGLELSDDDEPGQG